MKKTTIIGTILALMLLVTISSALAFSMPHPVLGVITADGYPVSNLEVEVKNLVTGTEQITTTNSNGQYQVELGNTNPPYYEGNTLKVTISYCGDFYYCSKTDVLMGGFNRLSFDVAAEHIPDSAKIIQVQCLDGSSAESISDCPVSVVCWDDSLAATEEDCPEKDSTTLALSILGGILSIALLIIGKFKWGKGFVGLANYYKRLGDEAKARGDNAVAEKNYLRAAKMVSTAISRAKDGTYY